MKTYRYAACLEPGEDHGITVSFPGLPEAISQGDDRADALSQAEQVLGLTMLAYVQACRPLPAATGEGPGVVMISPALDVAGKVALIEAFRDSGLTVADLASRIGREERDVRRLLDPFHPSKLTALMRPLQALGKRLVIAVDDAA